MQQGSTVAMVLVALSRKWRGYTESDPLSTVYLVHRDPYRCFLGRCSTEMLSWINSALMDTGANVGVFNSSGEQNMTHSTKSCTTENSGGGYKLYDGQARWLASHIVH